LIVVQKTIIILGNIMSNKTRISNTQIFEVQKAA